MPRVLPRAVVRRTLATFATALCLGGGVATTPWPAHAAAPPPRWEYTVRVAPDLASIHVRLCFRDFVPRRLWLADASPLTFVKLLGSTGMTLSVDPTQDGTLVASGVAGDACFEYAVDVAPLVEAGVCDRCGADVITRPGSWLFRAGFLPRDLEATVRFELPPGIAVAAPWPHLGAPDTYRIDPATWPFIGHVAFGHFTVDRFVAAGCPVELARLDGALAATPAGLRRWITTAMEADAHLYDGRFAEPRLLVMVRPSEGGGDPVPFGSTWYGGGPHTILYLAHGAKDDALPGEWVAVHELLHATLPSVSPEDPWFSEGFVTYYQEVVRARAGIQTPEQAWQEIEEGFERGRGDRRAGLPLGELSRKMYARHAFWRVYWSGAAIAFLLDVELRRASAGRQSLDDVMQWVREMPGAGEAPLHAADIVAEVDRRLGAARFQPLVEPKLASAAFPDVSAAQAWLGIDPSGPRVRLLPDAPGATVRDAIMRGSRRSAANLVPSEAAPSR